MKIIKPKLDVLNLTLIVFPVLASVGFYGYGRDLIRSYFRIGPLPLNSYVGIIGWNISATKIGDFAIGPLIASFFILLSLSYIFKYYFNPSSFIEKLLINTSFLSLIHSWPVILPVLNVTRQGIATGLFYYILLALDKQKNTKISNKNNILLLSTLFIVPIFHKLGILFLLLTFFAFVTLSLDRAKRRIYIILNSYILYYIIDTTSSIPLESRSIGLNITPLLFLTASIYCLFILFSRKPEILERYIFLIPYYMNIACIAYFLNGYNWEFERLQMVVLIPQLVAYLITVKGIAKFYLLTIISIVVLFLTIYIGVFRSFSYF